MSEPLILPDSRLRETKNVVVRDGVNWVPIFCANCGADGGIVPEENTTFAFYLCNPCAEKYGNIEGTYVESDVAFWEKVHAAQLEKYGRVLEPGEIVEQLKDGNSLLSKLARERGDYNKKGRG